MLASYLARLSTSLLGMPARGRLGALDESRVTLWVWPTDIDTYGHVNNGRYLTLMDLGRFDLLTRSGMLWAAAKRGWSPVVRSATVRFRKELRPLQRFELSTRISTWDDRWLYFEHRIFRGQTLHTWAAVQVSVKKKGARVTPAEWLGAVGIEAASPEPEGELERFVASQRLH